MRRILAFIALPLAGCIENRLGGKDAGVGDTDTAGVICESAEGQVFAVPVRDTCTLPEVDWSLRARWSFDDLRDYLSLHVGRPEDGNGDGLISLADPVAIWLTSSLGESPQYRLSGTGTLEWSSDEWSSAHRTFSTIDEVDSDHLGNFCCETAPTGMTGITIIGGSGADTVQLHHPYRSATELDDYGAGGQGFLVVVH